MSLILLLPQWAVPLMWLWAVIVMISVVQRFSYIVVGLTEMNLARMREEFRRRSRLG